MNKRLLIPVLVLVLALLACNLSPSTSDPSTTNPSATKAGQTGKATQPSKTPKASAEEKPAAPPTATPIPSEPVGVRYGLATLNSYTFRLKMASAGPDAVTSSSYTLTLQHSSDQEATVTMIDTISQSPDSPEPSSSKQEMYRVGTEQCSGSAEDGYSYQAVDPAQDELQQIMIEMIDFSPTITNPQFQNTETINGVKANHFTFKLEGLGATSGVEVIANQGEYWLAVDGNYLVRYILQIETRPNPDEQNKLQIEMDLTGINQPLSLAMPAGCIEAKNNPTPES